MSVDNSVSASMFKTEKDFLRAKYKFQSKEQVEKQGGGKTPLATLLAKKKYFEDANLTFNQATSSLANSDKSLGIKDKDGNTVKGDSVITMGFSYLNGEEWMVAYSGSGVSTEAGQNSPTEDTQGEFTLVGKNNGWNFKIKKADWGPFGSTNIDNIKITETISTSTTVTLNPPLSADDGEVVNGVTYTSGRGGISPAWNSGNVVSDTIGTAVYTSTSRMATQATKDTSNTKWWCGRVCVYFDTSTIPSGKTITAAQLKLTLQSAVVTDSYGDVIGLFKWDEFVAGRGTRIDMTDFDGFDSTTGGEAITLGTTGGVESTWNITGNLLSDLASNYTSGYGFMLRSRLDYDASTLTPTGTNFYRFYSKDHSTSSQYPKLVVTYE